ncbi:FliI/YscN family ATPase [Jannaschia rubra]|uniref:Putative ATP synthase YscN n=1 Tax=Jannaschia rubra TaxID=282197 RepID=A0A0M6XQ30_9RHOB|nr:FliI/YscN family ATPase [Jannaschia rubra]CTQ33229.1 putative ATP synthase YscN [Jannaschia rubra]SFF97434.1 flagellum-specific ATP synthase [Jannaschia rubra]
MTQTDVPPADPFASLRAQVASIRAACPLGRIASLDPSGFVVEGLSDHALLGDELVYEDAAGAVQRAEVSRLDRGSLRATPFGAADGLRIGLPVRPAGGPRVSPHDGWIGRIVDPFGRALDDRPLAPGVPVSLRAPAPAPARRRGMGARLSTGLAVFDTMLPIAMGQRIGLFAGSGVGKSTLLGDLARNMEADVCVLALVGERGREVSDFVRKVLGPEGMARTVVVAATSDMPANMRRRCAFTALAVAEHFRDRGRRVLFLCDSLTRLAEAHREVATAAGEEASLRGHPPSLTPLLASLCERAGPGEGAQGDITAVFTVLVAGSDMEEPVADIVRGQLDGHVVLSREIAEAGRFPAVDVLRSVSRSLPGCAAAEENVLIGEVRKILGVHDRTDLMVTSGLYERGSNPEVDRATALVPRLNEVFTARGLTRPSDGFRLLAGLLGRPYSGGAATA